MPESRYGQPPIGISGETAAIENSTIAASPSVYPIFRHHQLQSFPSIIETSTFPSPLSFPLPSHPLSYCALTSAAAAAAVATAAATGSKMQLPGQVSAHPYPRGHPATAVPAAEGNRKRKSHSSTIDPGAAPSDETVTRAWTKEQDQKLRAAITAGGPKNWKQISEEYFHGEHSDTQCLNRWYKVLRPGLIKGPWTNQEDEIILSCIRQGITKWSEMAARIPGRLGKQCRERFINHLDPNIHKGGWTQAEDHALLDAQATWGNAWTKIAECLPGRSENAVKNRWNSALLTKMRRRRGKIVDYEEVEVFERAVVAKYCQEHQEAPDIADFHDWTMRELQTHPNYTYIPGVQLPGLKKRLRYLLEHEVQEYPTDSPLLRAVICKKSKISIKTATSCGNKKGRGRVGLIDNGTEGHVGLASSNSGGHTMGGHSKALQVEDDRPYGVAASLFSSAPPRTDHTRVCETPHQDVDELDTASAISSISNSEGSLHQEETNTIEQETNPVPTCTISRAKSLCSNLPVTQKDRSRSSESSLGASPSVTSMQRSLAAAPSSHKFDAEHSGMRSLALAVSALDESADSLPSSVLAHLDLSGEQKHTLPTANHATRSHMREVISFLFTTMRTEQDVTKKKQYQEALLAATQEHPAVVNLVEGVMSGTMSSHFDLQAEDDRELLLGQILALVQHKKSATAQRASF